MLSVQKYWSDLLNNAKIITSGDNMIFGYMRVSKKIQKHDREEVALLEYAEKNNFKFDEIFKEKVSGASKIDEREEYSKLKNKARKGDIIVFTDVDRLGRNADDTILQLKELKTKGIRYVILDTPILNEWEKAQDNKLHDMVSDIFTTLKAHMAQQEREKLIERINQGLDAARKQGKKLGRPQKEGYPKNFEKHYKSWKSSNITATDFAKLIGVKSRTTLYTYIKEYEGDIKEVDKDNAINLYQQGSLKLEDISKITGITKHKIIEILKEEGVYKIK